MNQLRFVARTIATYEVGDEDLWENYIGTAQAALLAVDAYLTLASDGPVPSDDPALSAGLGAQHE
jgi:hypothetical protein